MKLFITLFGRVIKLSLFLSRDDEEYQLLLLYQLLGLQGPDTAHRALNYVIAYIANIKSV
jgi:hypothetical protein